MIKVTITCTNLQERKLSILLFDKCLDLVNKKLNDILGSVRAHGERRNTYLNLAYTGPIGNTKFAYNISFLKHAIKSLGFDFGDPRPPYRQLTKEEMLEIDEMIAPIVAAEEELAATVVS